VIAKPPVSQTPSPEAVGMVSIFVACDPSTSLTAELLGTISGQITHCLAVERIT